MEYRITDNASREAVFSNAEQYISDAKTNWMYMGTFSGMDEFKHSDTREVKKVPVETVPGLGTAVMNWDDKQRLIEIKDLIMDAETQLRNFKDDNDALDLESAHIEIQSALADVQDFLNNSYWGPEGVQS